MPQVGERLGRYRIEEQIGAGGMGVVYRAYDEKLQRRLAIKVISPGALNDEAARASRWKRSRDAWSSKLSGRNLMAKCRPRRGASAR